MSDTNNLSDKGNSNFNLPTLLFVIGTVIITSILIFYFLETRKKLDNAKTCYSVFWKNTDSTEIKSGPNWFLYDCKSDSIKSLKSISELEKSQLLNLASNAKNNCDSFNKAIDLLSFKSNSENNGSYYLLLIISSICGAIGVQLRTINNFIGVACFKNDFNYKVWWPWYVLRPLIGALIGSILFTLVDGNLYSTPTEAGYSQTLIIAMSILAGFGSEDFLNLLRNLSKRFFGTQKGEEKNS